MFFLIDCYQDNTVVIRTNSELKVDREPEVDETVNFIWKGGANKQNEYTGKVIAKSGKYIGLIYSNIQ